MNNQFNDLKKDFPFNIIWFLGQILFYGGKTVLGDKSFFEKEHLVLNDIVKGKVKKSKKKDHFAYSYKSNSPVNTCNINFNLNNLIIGSTGAGKTVLSERLLLQQLDLGDSVVFVDPKGSVSTKNRIELMAKVFGKAFYDISVDSDYSLRLFDGDKKDVAIGSIMKALDWSEPYYKNISKLELSDTINGLPTGEIDLKEICKRLKEKKNEKISGLVTQIQDIVSKDLFKLINGGEQLSLRDIREQNAVLYIGLSSLDYKEETKIIGKLIVLEMMSHAGMCEKVDGPSYENRLQFFIDEFSSIGTSTVIDLLNKARSSGVLTSLCVQSISDLLSVDDGDGALKGRLIDNTNNFFIGHTNDPDSVTYMSSIIGTRSTTKVTEQVDHESRTGVGTTRDVNQYLIHPEIFKNLNPGQFVIKSGMPGRYWDVVQVYQRDYLKNL